MHGSLFVGGENRAQWFATTHWSVVLAAAEEGSATADGALERLCHAYWHPIYATVRRRGYDPHTAQDLTQAFFARLLEGRSLHSVRREKGRFRSFLLACLGHFLANEWRNGHTQKRGGGAMFVPLDLDVVEDRFAAEGACSLPSDLVYDREWAVRVLEQAMEQLELEASATDRHDFFQALRPFLVEPTADGGYEGVARQHQMTAHAVSMAVSRLRGRLRAVVREIVAQTVSTPLELEEELQYLQRVLRQ